MSILPPPKKLWRPGTHQLGVFIRYPDGSVTETTHSDNVTPAMVELAQELVGFRAACTVCGQHPRTKAGVCAECLAQEDAWLNTYDGEEG